MTPNISQFTNRNAKSCPRRLSPPLQKTITTSQIHKAYSAIKVNRLNKTCHPLMSLLPPCHHLAHRLNKTYHPEMSILPPCQPIPTQLYGKMAHTACQPIPTQLYGEMAHTPCQPIPTQLYGEITHAITRKNVELAVMTRQMHTFLINVKEVKWMITELCHLTHTFIQRAKKRGKEAATLVHIENIKKEIDRLGKRFECIEQWNESNSHSQSKEEHHGSIGPYVNQNSTHTIIKPVITLDKIMSPNRSLLGATNKENHPPTFINLSNEFEKVSLPKNDHHYAKVAQLQCLLTQKQQQIAFLLQSNAKNQAQLKSKIAKMNKKIQQITKQLEKSQSNNIRQKIAIQKHNSYLQKELKQIGQLADNEKVWKEIRLLQKQLQIQWSNNKDNKESCEQNGTAQKQKHKTRQMKNERNKKMQQIMNLEYDIKRLISKKQSLQVNDYEQTAKMMLMQALTLEEILLT